MSGLKDERTRLRTAYFLVLVSAMRFGENPFTCQCKKEKKEKRLQGFYSILSFCLMSSDAKGLRVLIFIGRFQVTP